MSVILEIMYQGFNKMKDKLIPPISVLIQETYCTQRVLQCDMI